MRLTHYQPDIPQNGGAVLRLATSVGVEADPIEPFGFTWDHWRLRCAEMDYLDAAKLSKHQSWAEFDAVRGNAGLVLLTTRGSHAKSGVRFPSYDILLLRREFGGIPIDVHAQADQNVAVAVADGTHSLNVAAIALGQALHQTGGFSATGVLETVP